jgi:hypothetical protein
VYKIGVEKARSNEAMILIFSLDIIGPERTLIHELTGTKTGKGKDYIGSYEKGCNG